jgi:Tol biopolymer transport system component
VTGHTTFRELASAALDFDLRPDEREALSAHLATCSECRAFADGIRQDVVTASSWPALDAPLAIRSVVLASATTRTSPFRAVALSPTRVVAIAIALVVALIAGAFAVGAWIDHNRPRVVLPAPFALPSGEWIVYSADGHLFLVHPDGTGTTPIPVPGVARASEPVWSPDGRRLAFVGDGDVMTMDQDGRVRNLTSDALGELDPAWSHDGRSLAFGTWDGSIQAIGADGTARRTVVQGIRGDLARWPAWAPDGQVIAFLGTSHIQNDGPTAWTSFRAGRIDGTSVAPRFMLQRGGARPSWSPAGRVAFEGCMCKGSGQQVLYAFDEQAFVPETSGPLWSFNGFGPGGGGAMPPGLAFTALTEVPDTGIAPSFRGPAWSPNGTRIIAFQGSGPTFDGVPAVLSPGGTPGSAPRVFNSGSSWPHTTTPGGVTEGGAVSALPPAVWSADGSRVAYITYAGIAVLNVDSGQEVDVRVGAALDGLDWRPNEEGTP